MPVATPTPIPTPTEPPSAPEGSVVQAFRSLGEVIGVAHLGWYASSTTSRIGGIQENMFIYGDGSPMFPELVDNWDIDPAGTRIRIRVLEDIPFNSPVGFEFIDFGEFNAYEFVEWLNRSNATTNPDSRHPDSGDFAAIFLEATELSEYEIEIDLVSPVFFCVPLSQFGCLSAASGVHKVTTVELMGEEWAMGHQVGTGPFVQGECLPWDRCTLHAVPDHWRKTSNIAEITGVNVPDPNTRIAMLETGVVDMGEVEYGQLPGVLASPNLHFLETQPGGYVGQSVIFAGNLWEEFHARTGEPLNPWNSEVYDIDRAWLGDPWQEDDYHEGPTDSSVVRYTDVNNPVGMTDMEQARLVRLALSTAISRSDLIDNHLAGGGIPLYSEYMGPEYPGWDASRNTGTWDAMGNQLSPVGGVQWELLDGDLATAEALLDLAGYPRDGGGLRDIPGLALNLYPAETGGVSFPIGEEIVAMWNSIGVPAFASYVNYGGVVSPKMRQRTQFEPVLKNGDVHSNIFPLDWPLPLVDTSSSRPGWGVGFESKAGARWLFEILGQQDPSIRSATHLDWVDYSMFWVQYAGVYQVPKGIVANTRIVDWSGRHQHYVNVANNPEYIILAQ
jgi:ABC-type transport system substrate-binding protein